ncbi:hypothetical protein ANCCAN_14673 [Ancylostoma caninum]|uniref:Plexin repeat-containing domain protein n=1 Tax=Ancylostoma caninum TaxID=29170 RepID=A0A368G8R5_ANCCA|nr:hypothetical protein ANCCAN_14673 [Ancylostoma caninum]
MKHDFEACIQFATCEACSNATLKHFTCSWCHAKKSHGGPFCTDQAGIHRRRQHWAENNCKNQGKNMYCNSATDEEELEDDRYMDNLNLESYVEVEHQNDSFSSTPASERPSSLDDVIPLNKERKTEKAKSRTDGGGYAALVFILGCSLCLVGWLAYAYYNPHTTSGQLLIKYRPSRWRVPSSHVRYSASVHM